MINNIKMMLKRFTCKHTNQTFVRNIYGDEINWAGGKRSIWKCNDCGKIIFNDELNRSVL